MADFLSPFKCPVFISRTFLCLWPWHLVKVIYRVGLVVKNLSDVSVALWPKHVETRNKKKVSRRYYQPPPGGDYCEVSFKGFIWCSWREEKRLSGEMKHFVNCIFFPLSISVCLYEGVYVCVYLYPCIVVCGYDWVFVKLRLHQFFK